MSARRTSRRGNAMLEFTLVGIPVIFILISIFEMARGMWSYHTLAYAVKEGTRFAVVKGQGCTSPNTCSVTIADVVGRVQWAAVGLDVTQMNVQLTSRVGTITCNPLSSCLTRNVRPNDVWPPDQANMPGMDLTIAGTYPFRSVISMFWPGSRGVSARGTFTFPAASTESIQF